MLPCHLVMDLRPPMLPPWFGNKFLEPSPASLDHPDCTTTPGTPASFVFGGFPAMVASVAALGVRGRPLELSVSILAVHPRSNSWILINLSLNLTVCLGLTSHLTHSHPHPYP